MFYSLFKNRPKTTGQRFTQPSLTDELADEPLSRIFERYLSSGRVPQMADGDVDANAGDEALDAALADSALDDVSCMTKVEQQDVLVTAQRLVEQLQQQRTAASLEEERKSEASATGAQAASKDSITESKVAENAQNG